MALHGCISSANVVAAATTAFTTDARGLAEGGEKGFVSDGSKSTYNKKFVIFSCLLLENKAECIANGHSDKLLNITNMTK